MLSQKLTNKEKDRQDFEPENFKEYINSLNINETQHCSTFLCREAKENRSWISTKPSLYNNFTRIGSLVDNEIKSHLSYLAAYDDIENFWYKDSIIATGFNPYNNSEVFQCNACGNLFSVYTETSNHFPEERMRWIRKDLIHDEVSNAYFLLKHSELEHFAKGLGISLDEFNTQYEQETPKFYSILDTKKVLLYNFGNHFKSKKYLYIHVCTDREKYMN